MSFKNVTSNLQYGSGHIESQQDFNKSLLSSSSNLAGALGLLKYKEYDFGQSVQV